MPAALDRALRRASALGPYFTLEPPSGAGWQPLRALVAEPAVLRGQVEATRTALAGLCDTDRDHVDARAAASIHFLGLAARVLSPAFGAAVLGGVVPVLDLDSVHWRAPAGTGLTLAHTGHRGGDTGDGSVDALARALHEHVVGPVMEPLVAAARAEFRTSPRVLWGDVASAVGGAVIILGQAEPAHAERAAALAVAVLGDGPLVGTARLSPPGGSPFALARNSCCLYYRLPGGSTCSDCVLRHPVAARPPRLA